MQGCTLGLCAPIYNQMLLKQFSLHFPSVRTHKQHVVPHDFTVPSFCPKQSDATMCANSLVFRRDHIREILIRNSTQLGIQQAIKGSLMLICFLYLTLKKAMDLFCLSRSTALPQVTEEPRFVLHMNAENYQ